MEFSNKCLGCGVAIDHKTSKKNFCFRCFQLKNYNKLVDDDSLINNHINYLVGLNENKFNIYLITDIFNIHHDIQYFANSNLKNIDLIINKMDLLPQKFNFNLTNELVKKTLSKYNLKVKNILYTSIYNQEKIKTLNDFLSTNNRFPNIFLGYSNVGKSSLINSLLKVNNLTDQICLASCYINTTNKVKKYDLNNYQLIDYPGIYDSSNILNYVDKNDVKNIIDYKFSKPYQLQIYQSQRFYIDDLVIIDVILKPNKKSTVTFYLSPKLKIKRKNLKNIQDNISINKKDFKQNIYDININAYKTNFNIYGLGLFVFHKGVAKVIINTKDNVLIEKLPFALI